jgi:hypothetical protein
MNRVYSVVCAVALLAASSASRAADVLDRIVATVNGHIILQSDWDDALRYQAFEDGRTLEQLPPAEHKAALDRLIDQELLREQMHSSDFQHASDQEVADPGGSRAVSGSGDAARLAGAAQPSRIDRR